MALAAVVISSSSVVTSCVDATDCTPTTLDAAPASRLDLSATSRSSTLEARLSVEASGEPLAGKSLRFAVTDDGAEIADVRGSTVADGVARVDLKRINLPAVEALARGNAFAASFAGDTTYCSSADSADFGVTQVPGGPSVNAP